MGASHAISYENHDGFEICGLVSRGDSKVDLNNKLKSDYKLFQDYKEAIDLTKPDAVCISTYPDTHKEISLYALENDCHIFLEKPVASDLRGARIIIDTAIKKGKKIVVGYILRHHPIWKKFIVEAKKMGRPLAMRMNLNQQSSGDTWSVHKNLLNSLSPIVDCGVHYLDVMCQITESKPLSVSAIGVRLTDEIPDDNYNYGQLQIRFSDGSVGWYESAWGPMISETAFFVKDVIGPKGSVYLLLIQLIQILSDQ
jgi:predicted dehydrogenase